MLMSIYLVAIAGYLFPIKMPQKLWQLFSVAAHLASPFLLTGATGPAQPGETAGQPTPALP